MIHAFYYYIHVGLEKKNEPSVLCKKRMEEKKSFWAPLNSSKPQKQKEFNRTQGTYRLGLKLASKERWLQYWKGCSFHEMHLAHCSYLCVHALSRSLFGLSFVIL
jgi:predicted secreted Zn-dependent protease